MTRHRVTVMLGSDNRLFRESLRERLSRDRRFRIVAEGSAGDLLTKIRLAQPQLLLFDTDALGPIPDGLLIQIRARHPQLRILALAPGEHEAAAAQGLRLGASGILSKTEGLPVLLRAMAAVASGETWAPSKAIASALSSLAERRATAAPMLTMRERQILSLLAEGYRNKELAALLKIKEQTVKIHLHSLFRKLNVRTRVEAALKAAHSDMGVPPPERSALGNARARLRRAAARRGVEVTAGT